MQVRGLPRVCQACSGTLRAWIRAVPASGRSDDTERPRGAHRDATAAAPDQRRPRARGAPRGRRHARLRPGRAHAAVAPDGRRGGRRPHPPGLDPGGGGGAGQPGRSAAGPRAAWPFARTRATWSGWTSASARVRVAVADLAGRRGGRARPRASTTPGPTARHGSRSCGARRRTRWRRPAWSATTCSPRAWAARARWTPPRAGSSSPAPFPACPTSTSPRRSRPALGRHRAGGERLQPGRGRRALARRGAGRRRRHLRAGQRAHGRGHRGLRPARARARRRGRRDGLPRRLRGGARRRGGRAHRPHAGAAAGRGAWGEGRGGALWTAVGGDPARVDAEAVFAAARVGRRAGARASSTSRCTARGGRSSPWRSCSTPSSSSSAAAWPARATR